MNSIPLPSELAQRANVRDESNFKRFLAGSKLSFYRAFWENSPKGTSTESGAPARPQAAKRP